MWMQKREKSMIQDIAPYRYDNQYILEPPNQDSFALYFRGSEMLIAQTEEGIVYPTFRDLERLNKDIYENCTYLFSIDQVRYYLVHEIFLECPSIYQLVNTEVLRGGEPQYQAFAGITAHQLYNWYDSHKYCGRCGGSTRKDPKVRMLSCKQCKNMIFPKISPAVIIGVVDGERILLSQYSRRNHKHFALLTGFVEIGETLEETVKREVMEEVGLKVTNVRYYKSQPWSFSDTLLMGFYCDLVGDDVIILDEEELDCAAWFTRNDIPVEPSRDSLTNEMIMNFKEPPFEGTA